MIKILEGFTKNSYGGISQYIYNSYLYRDESKIEYDFLYLDSEPYYAPYCKAQGSNFYRVPKIWQIYQYYRLLKSLYVKKHYDYIYFNISYCNCVPVLLSKLAGFKQIVCHAHANGFESTNMYKKILIFVYHRLSKIILKILNITMFFSCSKEASSFMFGNNKTIIIKNAIDVSKYIFNNDIRKIVREKLRISNDTLVMGHVGRFEKAKNHMFLIRIFEHVLCKNNNVKLLLIGTGSELQKVKEYIKEKQLMDKVIFLGTREDVHELLQAMDVFVMPSEFEGFGMACLEAQASGLPCIISDRIPKSVGVTPLVKYLSLSLSVNVWANVILSEIVKERQDYSKLILEKGFDLKEETKRVEQILKAKLKKEDEDNV